MHIRLIKQVDAVVGRALALTLPAARRSTAWQPPASMLVIRPGGIGDAVLLAPTLIELKRNFLQMHLTVLAEQRNAGVFQLIPCVDRVLRYDRPREFFEVFRSRYDVVMDTEQSHRLSAVVGRLVRAGLRIGFATNERARLFHAALPYAHEDYEAKSFFRLLTPLGLAVPFSLKTPFLSVPPIAKRHVDAWLAPVAGKQPLVVLFPGASIPERRWGVERFAQVAVGLAQRGAAIVTVGGTEDAASAATIAERAFGIHLAGQTTLAETAAVVERAALLVSGDSGILHIGVGTATPTVSLFGPGIARKWAPQGPNHVVLNKHYPCSPCTRFGDTKPCPTNASCLQAITPQEVMDAARSLLTSFW